MKIIESIVLEDFTYPDKLRAFIPPESFILFDIETTGLSHSKSEVILIGYIIYDGKNFVLYQIFCENRSEENELLQAFNDAISDKPYYVTFNGRAFDLPYTNSRFKAHDISSQMPKCRNLDIMRLVKHNKERFDFPDFKLKTVEKFLGIKREDTISGKESVELYELYERTSDPELERKILLHNYEDILYLMKCLEIVNHVDHDTLYLEMPLTVSDGTKTAYIEDMIVKGDKLIVTLYSNNFSKHDHFDYGANITWAFNSKAHHLEISCPVFTLHVENEAYVFADTDLMMLSSQPFNEMTYEDKMNHLVSYQGKPMHQNIYRLIQLCFEQFQ